MMSEKRISDGKLSIDDEKQFKMPRLSGSTKINLQPLREIDWGNIESGENFKVLGEGTFGKVFQAVWNNDGQKESVAIKVIKSGYTERILEKIIFEAKISAYVESSLGHCNSITSVHGLARGTPPESIQRYLYFASNGRSMNCITAIVMRLETGGSLKDITNISRKYERVPSLAIFQKLQIANEIAKAIRDIHKIGLVHGDIKPDNILFSGSDIFQVRLADFGFSVFRDRYKDRALGTSLGQSLTNDVKCSALYGAPELLATYRASGIKGTKCTRSADMYAFGVVLYQLLVEREPYTDQDTMGSAPAIAGRTYEQARKNLAEFVCRGGRPDLTVLPSDTPDGVAEIIEACWKPVHIPPEYGDCDLENDDSALDGSYVETQADEIVVGRMSAEECSVRLQAIMASLSSTDPQVVPSTSPAEAAAAAAVLTAPTVDLDYRIPSLLVPSEGSTVDSSAYASTMLGAVSTDAGADSMPSSSSSSTIVRGMNSVDTGSLSSIDWSLPVIDGSLS